MLGFFCNLMVCVAVYLANTAQDLSLIHIWNPALVSWVLDLASATPEVRPYAQTFIQILCAGFILQCIRCV